jgi:hydrogenase maturation factor HypE
MYEDEEFKILSDDDIKVTPTNKKIQRAVKIILEHATIKSSRESKHEMYIYNPATGYYTSTGESFIASYCVGDLYVNDKIQHIIKNIRGATGILRAEFNEPPDKICLINGVLD